MIFEFVIVYQRDDETPIQGVLTERIGRILTDNMNEFDDGTMKRMVQINYERRSVPTNGEITPVGERVILGFSLDLPDETASVRTVINEFTDALQSPPIEHIVKFEDPLLRQELAERAEELFALEMKLRRVLSVIYLHAYNNQPYDLLREESVKPMNPATLDQMQKFAENEFFFLTFGQYADLNQRPDMARLPLLVELIRSRETYEALKTELERLPVGDEDDAVFIASLKQRMNAIDTMRNCVAHNRRPSKRVTNNYLTALPQVEQALDVFLAHWSSVWQEEMPWDTITREAVEKVMESAEWDEEAKTITLGDADGLWGPKTVSTRGELEDCLCECASMEFYANAPRDDGEFVFKCDEDSVVEGVLSDYEELLISFFASPY